MDSVAPAAITAAMVQSGTTKARLGVSDMLIRGVMSGALLGIATSLALGAAVQTGQLLVGALIFPVGFVMIVLLVPVTLGNLVGGFDFVALAMFATYARNPAEAKPASFARTAES